MNYEKFNKHKVAQNNITAIKGSAVIPAKARTSGGQGVSGLAIADGRKPNQYSPFVILTSRV